MYELKKLERCLRAYLLGPGPRFTKTEFTGLRSHKGLETLLYKFRVVFTSIIRSSRTVHTAPGMRQACLLLPLAVII